MEVGPAGEHRQCLVGGIAAQGGAEVHGVAALGQKFQVGPVGVIHQQRDTAALAHRADGIQVQLVPQVIRAGQVQGEGLLRLLLNGPLHLLRRYRAVQVILSGPKPLDGELQQNGRIQEAFVGIPTGKAPPPAAAFRIGQIQHGPDAQAGALAGVHRRAAEKPGGILLAFQNDPRGVKQVVSPGDLRNIPVLKPQKRYALMPRHVEPCRGLLGVFIYIITYGCVHLPSFSATWTIMAHSIRLRKSLQPYSYTPFTEPVAW